MTIPSVAQWLIPWIPVLAGLLLESGPDLAGHWTAPVSVADGDSIQLVVDLIRSGDGLAGAFDAAEFGIDNYPVAATGTDCQRGAREVRDQVMAGLADDRLAAYVVWEPILFTDTEGAAHRAVRFLDDPRVRHYWTDARRLGEAFQQPIGLETEPAWDVYLVYPAGVLWTDPTPPRPEFVMHQLGGRIPDHPWLHGPGLAAAIRRALEAAGR